MRFIWYNFKTTSTIEGWGLGCGKTPGVTIDRYSLTCGKTAGSTIDSYALNCGKTPSTIEYYIRSCNLLDKQIVSTAISYIYKY